MKVIAKADEYTIFQKRNNRYAVRGADRAWINGVDKVAILLEHKLIEVAAPKAAEAKPVADDGADGAEAAAETDEAVEDDNQDAQEA